jgi:hypothetical protein
MGHASQTGPWENSVSCASKHAGKRLLVLIGQKKALGIAVRNDRPTAKAEFRAAG